jgi:hypothetical protein
VDKLTHEEVYDGDKEFAWRKTKPSDKMRFKANNNGVIYRRHIHLMDERL